MTRLDSNSEPSMEDILASIRRIIAEQPLGSRPPAPPAPSAQGAGGGLKPTASSNPFAALRATTPVAPTPTTGFMAGKPNRPAPNTPAQNTSAQNTSASDTPAAAPVSSAATETASSAVSPEPTAVVAPASSLSAADLLAGLKTAAEKLGTPEVKQASPPASETTRATTSATTDAANVAADESAPQAATDDDPFSFDLGPSPFVKSAPKLTVAADDVPTEPLALKPSASEVTAPGDVVTAEGAAPTSTSLSSSSSGTSGRSVTTRYVAGRISADHASTSEQAGAPADDSETVAAAGEATVAEDATHDSAAADESKPQAGFAGSSAAAIEPADTEPKAHSESDAVVTVIEAETSSAADGAIGHDATTIATDNAIDDNAIDDNVIDDDARDDDPFAAVDAAASEAAAKLSEPDDMRLQPSARARMTDLRDDGYTTTEPKSSVAPDNAAVHQEASSKRATDSVFSRLRGSDNDKAQPATPRSDDDTSSSLGRASNAAAWNTSASTSAPSAKGFDAERPYTSRFSVSENRAFEPGGLTAQAPRPSSPFASRDMASPGYGFVPRPGGYRTTRDVMNLDDDDAASAATTRAPTLAEPPLPDAVTERIETGPPQQQADVEDVAADRMNAIATVVAESSNSSSAADSDNNSESRSLTVSDPDQRALEDTVADLLRPMLKSWLAENMPKIVERALRREISELNLGRKKSAAE